MRQYSRAAFAWALQRVSIRRNSMDDLHRRTMTWLIGAVGYGTPLGPRGFPARVVRLAYLTSWVSGARDVVFAFKILVQTVEDLFWPVRVLKDVSGGG